MQRKTKIDSRCLARGQLSRLRELHPYACLPRDPAKIERLVEFPDARSHKTFLNPLWSPRARIIFPRFRAATIQTPRAEQSKRIRFANSAVFRPITLGPSGADERRHLEIPLTREDGKLATKTSLLAFKRLNYLLSVGWRHTGWAVSLSALLLSASTFVSSYLWRCGDKLIVHVGRWET